MIVKQQRLPLLVRRRQFLQVHVSLNASQLASLHTYLQFTCWSVPWKVREALKIFEVGNKSVQPRLMSQFLILLHVFAFRAAWWDAEHFEQQSTWFSVSGWCAGWSISFALNIYVLVYTCVGVGTIFLKDLMRYNSFRVSQIRLFMAISYARKPCWISRLLRNIQLSHSDSHFLETLCFPDLSNEKWMSQISQPVKQSCWTREFWCCVYDMAEQNLGSLSPVAMLFSIFLSGWRHLGSQVFPQVVFVRRKSQNDCHKTNGRQTKCILRERK